ncbi:40S ribosomal protein S7 [Ceratobasidium sp. AG-Ba]|nr:40S ribosomal protein S7 [Ceratobasidium sp. AG-Ba]
MRNAAATNPELLVPPTEMPPGVPQEMVDTLAKQSKEEGDKLYREKKYQAAHDAYKYGCVLPTSDPNILSTSSIWNYILNAPSEDWFTVLRNTAWVLQTDPDSVKGLYRAARALLQLARFDEALDCCDRALKLEPHNKPLRKERQTALSGAILLRQMTLADVCAEAKSLTGDLYGIILLEAFRAGSEAEERFEEADFESLSDLAEPGYEASKTVTINTRYRNFNYGPPNRPVVNDENSVSFAARHGMIRILCGI